ncbi:MAG: sigma 54-interacting transcriptional regulator [Rubrivivax sp.]
MLLLGETGTGKATARARHPRRLRRRAGRAIVSVNIAAVPDTLLEAEFFGVAPGAYTGAERAGREGVRFADGGTLFLDEIGDMPLALQAKSLRALQEQEIEPLGSNRVERVDVRASSPPPAATCRRWWPTALPRRPLLPPERAADPPAGAARAHRGPGGARRGARRRHRAGAAAWRARARRPTRWTCWPRSVAGQHPRAPRNVPEQATLMTDDLQPDAPHRGGAAAGGEGAGAEGVVTRTAAPAPALLRPLAEQVSDVEDAIAAALEATGGNRVAAAKLLRMSRAALYARLARRPQRITVTR